MVMRSKLKNYLPQLIGRTVVKVLYCEPDDESNSPAQFIMELDNGATYEVYGRSSLGITGLCFWGEGKIESHYAAAPVNKQLALFADGKKVRCYSPWEHK